MLGTRRKHKGKGRVNPYMIYKLYLCMKPERPSNTCRRRGHLMAPRVIDGPIMNSSKMAPPGTDASIHRILNFLNWRVVSQKRKHVCSLRATLHFKKLKILGFCVLYM